jgi:hypothetical protein
MTQGRKTGGGSRKGIPNKVSLRTRDALWRYVEQAAQQDPMAHPVTFLTSIMTSPTTSTADPLTAALALLDRMLPKLSAVKLTEDGEQPVYTVQLVQYEQWLTQALDQAEQHRSNGHTPEEPTGVPTLTQFSEHRRSS